MAATESEDFVRAFARGLGVIEAMGAGGPRKTIAQVAEATGLPRSVVRRLMMTLCAQRFAQTDGKLFSLTPRALKLGLSYLDSLPFWRYAQPALEDLRSEVHESCSMAVLDDGDIVYVLRVPSRRILAMNLSVGSRLPANLVSLGRAKLDVVRRRGYAWVDGELDPAICGIAVPVRDGGGTVVAAINVSLTAGTFDEMAARRRFLVPLRQAAEQIRVATPA